jgi:flagellar biosynthesis/type III secretory pathway chaperone
MNIADLLTTGIQHCTRLREILVEEQLALLNNNEVSIEDTTEQKQIIVTLLNDIQVGIKSAGLSTDMGHTNKSGDVQLREVFRQLLLDCKRLNQKLGYIIHYRIMHTNKALEVLTGQANEIKVYTHDGKAIRNRTGSILLTI